MRSRPFLFLLFAFVIGMSGVEDALAQQTWPNQAVRMSPYSKAMWVGDRYTRQAREIRSMAPKLRFIERGLAFYERAATLDSKMAEPHYRIAEILNAYYNKSPPKRVRTKMLRHWERFAALAPLDPRVNNTLFGRALVHTRMGSDEHYRKAIEVYKKLFVRIDLESSPDANAALRFANMAEIYMMLGELEIAIPLYRLSLANFPDPLYAFGLAVALDRNGQRERAREVMLAYTTNRTLRRLKGDTVFFVPHGEEFYYLALGLEVLGHTEGAILQYQKFIDSGAHPRFHARARENILRLKEKGKTP